MRRFSRTHAYRPHPEGGKSHEEEASCSPASPLALGAGIAATAFAQAKPETLVKQRQAAMTLQGKYFGPLGGMAQGHSARTTRTWSPATQVPLEALCKMPWDGFAEGTKGVKSAALPAIWNDAAKFKQAQDQFHERGHRAGRRVQERRRGDGQGGDRRRRQELRRLPRQFPPEAVSRSASSANKPRRGGAFAFWTRYA